jgi:hypothetical protein
MRSDRVLIGAGFGCVLVAGSTLLVGGAQLPILSLCLLALGAVLLTVALWRVRGRSSHPSATDPARGELLVRIAFTIDAVLGAAAIFTAVVVAIGEARGHAIGHLVTGVVSLGLLSVLAFLWHPAPGSGPAMFRGLVLTLLAFAAFGSFVESLGGSGYDAANADRRIRWLASFHAVGLPFGAFVMVGVPIGLVTCAVVLIAHLRQRDQPLPT